MKGLKAAGRAKTLSVGILPKKFTTKFTEEKIVCSANES